MTMLSLTLFIIMLMGKPIHCYPHVASSDVTYLSVPEGLHLHLTSTRRTVSVPRTKMNTLVFDQRQTSGEFIGCSPAQLSILRDSISTALNYISDSIRYLNAKSGKRLQRSFPGSVDNLTSRKVIISTYQIISEILLLYKYNCDCSTQDTETHVEAGNYDIEICFPFWSAPSQPFRGAISKAHLIMSGAKTIGLAECNNVGEKPISEICPRKLAEFAENYPALP